MYLPDSGEVACNHPSKSDGLKLVYQLLNWVTRFTSTVNCFLFLSCHRAPMTPRFLLLFSSVVLCKIKDARNNPCFTGCVVTRTCLV